MNQKVLHIGIMPYQDYKTQSLAIARGEYRPRPNEPKIWFESVRSMAQAPYGFKRKIQTRRQP